jgi:hypothetical protein
MLLWFLNRFDKCKLALVRNVFVVVQIDVRISMFDRYSTTTAVQHAVAVCA